jgi:hypothetical protein
MHQTPELEIRPEMVVQHKKMFHCTGYMIHTFDR